MFHFPAFPPHTLCVQAWVTGFKVPPGFPIRKSSDRSSVGSSPRLIAASYVLHRLLVPRHPPCALNNLTTKMLASTVQFSRYGRSRPCHRGARTAKAIRRPTAPPVHPRLQPLVHNSGSGAGLVARGELAPSGPNSVPEPATTPKFPFPLRRAVLGYRGDVPGLLVSVPPIEHHSGLNIRTWPWTTRQQSRRQTLLRKEVIQPHLPVRLPCYDFVPIAGPTFDDSLPQGVGPPASGVTDFRDVTGGVYKARERIHRSVADLRLLATPTS
jgi:hypothetical protein